MKLLIPITLLVCYVAAAHIDLAHIPSSNVNDRIRPSVVGTSPQGRITNGEAAKPKQFPYQVGLNLYKDNRIAWCGGTLISNRWIITAAHCTKGVKAVDVFLGATNRTDQTEVGQQIVYVQKENVIVHEKWDLGNVINDISVLKLPVPISFNDHIQPAKLPKLNTTSSYTDKKVIASGWGRDSDASKKPSEILRWIEVPIMDNTECKRYYSHYVKDTHVCISTKGGKSICNGDSGGPIVLADGSNTLIGAASFGSSLGCEVEFPGVFTRITSYLDWIKKITGVANENL